MVCTLLVVAAVVPGGSLAPIVEIVRTVDREPVILGCCWC